MIRTTCQRCGAPLPAAGLGRPPRYCSSRCRVAAHRAKRAEQARHTVPAELRERRRWVRRGPDKQPLGARTGRPVSVTSPAAWSTWESAAASPHGTGLGYVLREGDGVVCVDLDGCLGADGSLAAWAAAIVDRCPPTYMEISPSGTGLHIWGRGQLPRGRRIRHENGAAIEAYGAGRYIAIGQRYGQAPQHLADLGRLVDDLTT